MRSATWQRIIRSSADSGLNFVLWSCEAVLAFGQTTAMNDSSVIPNSPNVYGPITPSQMFERTLALLRENAKLFFGIVLVVIGVQIVVGGVLGGSNVWMGHSTVGAAPLIKGLFLVPISLLGAALIYIFTQIIQGALFIATRVKLENVPMTVGDACRLAAEKAGRLVGISILVALRIIGYLLLLDFIAGLIVLAVAVLCGVSSHLADLRQLGHGFAPGIAVFSIVVLAVAVAYVCVMFWLALRYAVAIPASLEENLPVTDAIRRSIHLTRGGKGRLLALFIVLGFLWVSLIVLTVPLQLMAGHSGVAHAGLLVLLAAAIRIFFNWLFIAAAGVGTALCYFDLRVRKERFGASSPLPGLGVLPTLPPPATDWPIEDLPVS